MHCPIIFQPYSNFCFYSHQNLVLSHWLGIYPVGSNIDQSITNTPNPILQEIEHGDHVENCYSASFVCKSYWMNMITFVTYDHIFISFLQ